MQTVPPITIIGPGVVGAALGVLARQAGLTVAAVGARRIEAAQDAARHIGGDVSATGLAEATAVGGLVLLTVSDDAIESVCSQLAAASAFKAGAVVAHCSGALGSDVLQSAKLAGCSVGSMHPLQTFATTESAVANFAGVSCFCEGDDAAVAALSSLAEAIGGRPVRMASGGKALYHAAAVMAGNYVTALLDAAAELCDQADIEPHAARQALALLAEATARNAGTMDLPASLTGPIARGDVGTVRQHLAALQTCSSQLRKLYCVAGLRTVDLALQKGSIDDNVAQQLRQTLCSQE